LASCGVI